MEAEKTLWIVNNCCMNGSVNLSMIDGRAGANRVNAVVAREMRQREWPDLIKMILGDC